jgi:hypothetical protein
MHVRITCSFSACASALHRSNESPHNPATRGAHFSGGCRRFVNQPDALKTMATKHSSPVSI